MDLISRQDKIDAIDVLKRNYPSSCFEDLCKAVDIAIKALSAEPKWIPVTERLPEYERAVLVCESTYKNVFEACCIDGRWESFDTGNPCWLDETIYGNIVAWMPLPSPYEYPPKDFMNPPEGEDE